MRYNNYKQSRIKETVEKKANDTDNILTKAI